MNNPQISQIGQIEKNNFYREGREERQVYKVMLRSFASVVNHPRIKPRIHEWQRVNSFIRVNSWTVTTTAKEILSTKNNLAQGELLRFSSRSWRAWRFDFVISTVAKKQKKNLRKSA